MSDTVTTPQHLRPVAIVTGATNGIGRAIALDLSRTHCVFAVGRNASRLEALVAAAPSLVAVPGDVNDEAAMDALVDGLERIDVLVHSAAVAHNGAVIATTRAEWMEHLETNVVSPAALTRRALPRLRESRGTVVFIGSGAGTRARAEMGLYSATKHALKALADSLRAEESGVGVRVTTVAPGPVDTDMQRELQAYQGNEYEGSRFVQVDSVARAVRFVVDAPGDAQIPDLSVRPRR